MDLPDQPTPSSPQILPTIPEHKEYSDTTAFNTRQKSKERKLSSSNISISSSSSLPQLTNERKKLSIKKAHLREELETINEEIDQLDHEISVQAQKVVGVDIDLGKICEADFSFLVQVPKSKQKEARLKRRLNKKFKKCNTANRHNTQNVNFKDNKAFISFTRGSNGSNGSNSSNGSTCSSSNTNYTSVSLDKFTLQKCHSKLAENAAKKVIEEQEIKLKEKDIEIKRLQIMMEEIQREFGGMGVS